MFPFHPQKYHPDSDDDDVSLSVPRPFYPETEETRRVYDEQSGAVRDALAEAFEAFKKDDPDCFSDLASKWQNFEQKREVSATVACGVESEPAVGRFVDALNDRVGLVFASHGVSQGSRKIMFRKEEYVWYDVSLCSRPRTRMKRFDACTWESEWEGRILHKNLLPR